MIQKLPSTQRKIKPTQALINRIKAAIFSKAYNDDRLLEMMADHTKPDLQNMLNALGVAAPKFIEAQAISRNVQDISDQIVDGMEQAIDQRVANALLMQQIQFYLQSKMIKILLSL